MITIGLEQLTRIREHGVRDYPYECCGLLLGQYEEDGKVVEETYPISNAREESAKRNRFLIEPEELMRGEKYARGKELEVVGFYHSHPDSAAAPSQYDLEHAWPTIRTSSFRRTRRKPATCIRGSRKRIARGLIRKS
jgi:proteasome lid subunit RPN8/RPN11